MKKTANIIFIGVDILTLLLVLTIQIGYNEENISVIILFSVLVRIVILIIITGVGIIADKILKNDIQGSLATFLIGYFFLLIVYVNENGFNHWKRTILKIHTSWLEFGQVMLPFLVACIFTLSYILYKNTLTVDE